MRKTIATLLLLTFVQWAFGQDLVQFKVSKPYCIFNFLQTAKNQQNTSPTLAAHIALNTKGDTAFERITEAFAGLQLDYQYKRAEFPESRRQYRSTKDLVIIALVRANTIAEFRSYSVGILPNSEQAKLIAVLARAENYYNRIVWDRSQEKLSRFKEGLQQQAAVGSENFTRFQQFYNSNWSPEVPFLVSLYPIPAAQGTTLSTAFANSLCIGVLTGDSGVAGTLGVVMHEMCHVLYEEQPKEVQFEIEKWFGESRSRYKEYAYSFFDEGVATALGNGWAYKKTTGQLDTAAWYSNEYINGFGKALYPLVDDYLQRRKPIDKPFIDSAIALFAEVFPRSVWDYGILFNRISIYSDAGVGAETEALLSTIGAHFQLTHFSLSTPILEAENLEMLQNSTQTQLIIITKNHWKNFSALRKIFPQLLDFPAGKVPQNAILGFYDKMERPIIIVCAKEESDLPALMQKMAALKYFEGSKVIQN